MICADDRFKVICLIQEACNDGARKHKACEIVNISLRTLERWIKENGSEDKRKFSKRTPANKLTQEQYNMVLTVANSKEYRNCSYPYAAARQIGMREFFSHTY